MGVLQDLKVKCYLGKFTSENDSELKPFLLTVVLTHKNSIIAAIRRSTTITEGDDSESEHIHSFSHSWQSQNMDMYTDGSSSTSSDTVRHYC